MIHSRRRWSRNYIIRMRDIKAQTERVAAGGYNDVGGSVLTIVPNDSALYVDRGSPAARTYFAP